MTLITVRDLSIGYDNKVILSGLNFTVSEGDYLCIVGENGSGKTTLMRTLLGLRPPLAGCIDFAGGSGRNGIGWLPQQDEVQRDFPASVREIVLSGCQGRCRRPFYGRGEKLSAEKNMERMGVLPLAKRCYRELSGGQQQRVLLARALCAAERLLLLDEPVSGLDPSVTADMYSLIEKLNKDGVTVIMITHDVGAASKYASHVLCLGETVFFGTRDEYLERGAFVSMIAKGGGEA